MLIRVIPFLAAAVALIATITTASAVPSGVPLLQTATAPPTSTDFPTVTPIPSNTLPPTPTVVTPTAVFTATALPFPDLAVSMTTSVAGAGTTMQQITHNIEVRNVGSVATTQSTTLGIPVPQGATFAFANGCPPPDTAGNIVCVVPTLAPGAAATYQVVLNSTGATNQVVTVATLDPSQVIFNDVNRSNNTSVAVTPVTQTTFVTGVPTSTLIPTPTLVPPTPTPIVTVVVVTVPVPGQPQPTVAPPATAQPPVGSFRWIRILAPTEAVSNEDEVLWTAQPGELYYVVREESGWALAIWEGDTPFWQVWIRLDNRVQDLRLDRPGPGATIGQLWLVVFAATEAFTPTMAPAWTASPGEWYRVVLTESDWALAVWENDPPEFQVWIQIDSRVEITVIDLPGPTGRL